MKQKIAVLLCLAALVLAGCAQSEPEVPEESGITGIQPAQTQTTETETPDEGAYIGEYLDYDNNEPNLQIAKGDDGKYIIHIGIFRLTTLDGIGELTAEGMRFTATDAAGNPIGGIITVDNGVATVTFTDSTWELLENGSAFRYTKNSDVPNI